MRFSRSFIPAAGAIAGVAALLSLFTVTMSAPARAEFAVEEDDGHGVTNGADFSFRYYLDAMKRFPDRIGIICVHAYELDKSGAHDQAFAFFKECAKRDNPTSMIHFARMHQLGHGTPPDAAMGAWWLRRAAETGYSVAQYHWGVALLNGDGVASDPVTARAWLRRAADQGDRDAQRLLLSTIAGN